MLTSNQEHYKTICVRTQVFLEEDWETVVDLNTKALVECADSVKILKRNMSKWNSLY